MRLNSTSKIFVLLVAAFIIVSCATPAQDLPELPDQGREAVKMQREPKAVTIEDQLKKLQGLRQKYLITNEEYERAKKDVLKKLTE